MSMGLRSPNTASAIRRFDAQIAILLVGFAVLSCAEDGASRGHLFGASVSRRSLVGAPPKVFDVTAFGAKPEAGAPAARQLIELPGGGDTEAPPELPGGGGGDDKKDNGPDPDGNNANGLAFIRTWVAACRGEYKGPAKVVIPRGTFLTGPVIFGGPCTSSREPIIVEVQGEVRATTTMSDYPEPHWIIFERIDEAGVILTGGGIINGQGEKTWAKGTPEEKGSGPSPPSNVKFQSVKNALIEHVTSVNPKFFHFHVTDSANVTINNMHFIAPDLSPNTDGVHISDSVNVKVINSIIATGDDCVSIGQGCRQVIVNNVTCGPGHGISVGSLGKYTNEQPVVDVHVSNCTLLNTTNGARIKTYAGPNGGEASNIVYEDLILRNVKAPIIIDQNYGQKKTETKSATQSLYKLSDIHFRNIRGTSSHNVAVSLQCSAKNPCTGVELSDIDITYGGAGTKNTAIASECYSAKLEVKGKINPTVPVCQ